ncbi:hypothetical protein C8D88_108187 [Lentzea atacamensis]|uniref:Uncharacterized protein n=1 Tax=Lentzea atacamensis TaxID=531938 RepID=A0A316IBA9_9PSEU|nr:hypothetical protein C8D88_108187 [Lentzea atacamensis]
MQLPHLATSLIPWKQFSYDLDEGLGTRAQRTHSIAHRLPGQHPDSELADPAIDKTQPACPRLR